MTCYLGITCWEARHSLLDGDCMQGIQMWHIRWGLDARNPDVPRYPGAAGRDEKQANACGQHLAWRCRYPPLAPASARKQMKSKKAASKAGAVGRARPGGRW